MTFRTAGAILLATTSVIAVASTEDTVFPSVAAHYEAIRQALIEDSTDGVAGHAAAIAASARELRLDFNAAAAGVAAANAETVRALLPEIEERASRVATAGTLEMTRAELAELTKPLVRWHELVEGARPVVAYCSMEKRAWLQPEGPIGNPYAPFMLRCREVVQR